jgi:apolipoprotein N-acyltransferase
MIGAAAAAVLTALIFPKFNLTWLAWIALVPFFSLLITSQNRQEGLKQGFVFGFIFFLLHLYWLLTLAEFVSWWIVLGWIVLAIFQTLFILLFVCLVLLTKPVWRSWAIPFFWVMVEWLRAWGPFGVSGGDLGYSQATCLPLIQIASFTSVYGVSFLIALVNAAFAQIMVERKKIGLLIVATGLLIATLVYGHFVLQQASQPTNQYLKLALIQANIPQKEKLNPRSVPQIFAVHQELTKKSLADRPDIIIWPETALFTYLFQDQQIWGGLQELIRQASCPFIIGTPHYQNGKAYNSVVSISATGEVLSFYYKQHLVPFGEYLPFRQLLFPILKGVGYYDSEFASDQPPGPLRIKNLSIAAAVCFESVFPQVIKERVNKETAFILLVTNDAWFGNSAASYFHLNAGVLRAIENRRYFVQVGNTGFSALIDPFGRIIKVSDLNKQQVLLVKVPRP